MSHLFLIKTDKEKKSRRQSKKMDRGVLPSYLRPLPTKDKSCPALVLNIYSIADQFVRTKQAPNLLLHFVATLYDLFGTGAASTDSKDDGMWRRSVLRRTFRDSKGQNRMSDPLTFRGNNVMVLSPMMEVEKLGYVVAPSVAPGLEDEDGLWDFFRNEDDQSSKRAKVAERSSYSKVPLVLKKSGEFVGLGDAADIFAVFMMALDVFAMRALEQMNSVTGAADTIVTNHTFLSCSDKFAARRTQTLEEMLENYGRDGGSDCTKSCSLKFGVKEAYLQKCNGGVFKAPRPQSMDHRRAFDPVYFLASSLADFASQTACHAQCLLSIGSLYEHSSVSSATHRTLSRGITVETASIVYWPGDREVVAPLILSNPQTSVQTAQDGSYSAQSAYFNGNRGVGFTVLTSARQPHRKK